MIGSWSPELVLSVIRIKKIELELSDKSIVVIDEQPTRHSLKQLCDLIIRNIFTKKLQHQPDAGTEFAQWETAREIGMKSTSTIYRAVKRN